MAGVKKGGDRDRKRTLFIVDDNNYYRSMRQEYHRLARDAGAGFCQLHVAMTAEQAIRDELYKNRLPGKLILSKRKCLWEVLFS